MIRLKKLYSEPSSFDPIVFSEGLNLILGEKSEGNNKTNGVGKSICIECINFCLLKKEAESRLMLIPDGVLDSETIICLDIQINNEQLSIKRSLKEASQVSIFKNGAEVVNNGSIEIASNYLGKLYFDAFPATQKRISFRNMLNPVMRDERSEFKDIIQCFDTKKRIPNDYTPHLFFLSLDIDLYTNTNDTIKEYANKTAYVREIKKVIEKKWNKLSIARQKQNELEREVNKINASIEKLKNNTAFEVVQDELIKLENELKNQRIEQKAIKYEIRQIESLPEPENISELDMSILFSQFKAGLGDMIAKSLQEVKTFKAKIDSFRNTLINAKVEKLKADLLTINKKIESLDTEYSSKLKLIDKDGQILNDLKTTIRIFNEKSRELNDLSISLKNYLEAEQSKKTLLLKKQSGINDFSNHLEEKRSLVKEFEETIIWAHEKIIEKSNASFSLNTKFTSIIKEYLLVDYRIDDDGSWSTERMKVFLYDIALLFNKNTHTKHPNFLIHDNIFNIDNDSLERSLNFIHEQTEKQTQSFQYILTINRDIIESLEEKQKLAFEVKDYKIASFTKKKRFLKKSYSEQKRKK